jgi:hypothetical protein
MSSSSRNKSKTFTLLIEGATGVTEYVVGMMHVNDMPVFGPLAARVVSGRSSGLSLKKLQEAIELRAWAEANPDIFEDGRVVYDV